MKVYRLNITGHTGMQREWNQVEVEAETDVEAYNELKARAAQMLMKYYKIEGRIIRVKDKHVVGNFTLNRPDRPWSHSSIF